METEDKKIIVSIEFEYALSDADMYPSECKTLDDIGKYEMEWIKLGGIIDLVSNTPIKNVTYKIV